jgi:ABC-type branched-subunit amino acid transport system substrate-binding protein
MSVGQDPACAMRKDMNGIFPPDAYLISGDRADGGCIEDAGLVGKTDDRLVLTIATGQPATIPAELKGLIKGHGYPIYTFSAYDCARILIDAIGRAIRVNGGKIPSREQVLQAVASTTNFKGITGTYSFDANGDVTNPSFSFYTVNQGNWTFWRSP